MDHFLLNGLTDVISVNLQNARLMITMYKGIEGLKARDTSEIDIYL